MLFSWRKFLAGPVVKNAVQKDPWSPWEHTEFLQQGWRDSMDQGKSPSQPQQWPAAGGSFTQNFKGCFFRCEKRKNLV